MKRDFEERRGCSGFSREALAQKARSWKIRGIAQLVLAAVTVMCLTLYELRDSFSFLAIGLGCAAIMVILLLLSSRCPVCGHYNHALNGQGITAVSAVSAIAISGFPRNGAIRMTTCVIQLT